MSFGTLSEPLVLATAKGHLLPDSEGGYAVVDTQSRQSNWGEEEVDTTSEKTLETQRRLDADIHGTVDHPLSRDDRDAENQRWVNQSIQYGLEASDQHDSDGLLVASLHGYDPETVRNAIRYLEKNGDFDGYAFGIMDPIRTDYKKVNKILLSARYATNKPLYIYALGGLVYQPLLLYLGVDSFDSSAFIRNGGNRNYLIPGFGGEELRDLEELERIPCPCLVCRNRSLDDIREDRTALTQHNLWALATELRGFRYVVEAGRDIEEYLGLPFSGNEVTKRAYDTAKRQVRRLT